MDAWFHCENPYPFVPDECSTPRIRCAPACPTGIATPRSRRGCSRKRSTSICSATSSASTSPRASTMPGSTASMARARSSSASSPGRPSNIRLLSMGTLVTVRQDPVRAAEEYATADVISRGRLEIGFVKSGGTEMASGNANPIGSPRAFLGGDRPDRQDPDLSRRPVQLGGQALHPSPRQHLAPALSAAIPADVGGDLGPGGHRRTRPARHGQHHGHARSRRDQAGLGRPIAEARAEAGLSKPATDRFGYSAFVYVGDTDEEAVRVGTKFYGSSTPA